MPLFGQKSEEQVMGQFILSEMRDLRKGMEGRDGAIRGEIAAVRDAVTTLAESVSRSHTKVDSIQSDVNTLAGDVRRLRVDVDDIQRTYHVDTVKEKSAWDGPKTVLKNLGLVGTGAAAIVAVYNLWPLLLASLTAK